MKRIFLFGYTRSNLGDDLFILTLIRRYKSTCFYLYGNKKSSYITARNMKMVDSDSWVIRQAKKIRPSLAARIHDYLESRCTATVYIGGSLFIEYKNWKTILTWWEYVAEHRKFYVLGANFGPWHTEEYRNQMADIFSKMQDVCFRDTYSQKLFADVPSVRYAPDILLGYPMPKTSLRTKQAFVSVINCETKDEGDNQLNVFNRQYEKVLAELIDCLIEKGWKVVLSSFCKYEGDEAGIEKVLKNVQDISHIEVVNYDGTNTEKVLCCLAESEIVYGSRFHAVILGFAARRPVVPIIYSDKTKRVLEDMNFSGRLFDIREMNDNDGLKMAEIADSYEKQYLGNIDCLSEQSKEHFKALDSLIK